MSPSIIIVSNGSETAALLNGQSLTNGVGGITFSADAFGNVSVNVDINDLGRLEPQAKECFFEQASHILGYKLACEG